MSFGAVPALLLTALVSMSADGGSLSQRVLAQDSLPSLAGSVRSDGSDGFLRGAVVEVRQGLQLCRFRVDDNGMYHFNDLRPGPAELIVFHLAVHPFEMKVQLPARGQVELDLVLRHRVIPVAGVQVRAVPELNRQIPPLDRADRGRVTIGLRSLEATSGLAESGLTSVLSTEEPGEPGGVLYTRGSTVDARLVLLDGAPILTPFHVAGLVEPFDARMLGNAELYLGGAPSPYSGGVSYLLDVETRPARRDRPRLAVGADGLTLDALGEVPLPLAGSLLFGGRLLHGLQESIGSPDRFPYRYDDLLIRAGFSPPGDHDLRITAFQNHEGVRLDMGVDAPPLRGEALWGNRAVSVKYEGRVGGAGLETMAAASRYDSTLPVSWEDPVLASGVGDRLRVTGGVSVAAGRGSLRFGASVERFSFGYELDALQETTNTAIRDAALTLGTTEAGVFGEWDGSLSPGLALRAGIRADRYSHEGRLRVSPRLALRLSLGERVELFSAAGTYHQVLPAPGLHSQGGTDGTPPTLGWDPALPVASASHLVVGLEQEFDREIHLSLSAFAKGFSGLGQGGEDRSRSSGTELRVSREGDLLSGWFGYALSWFWVDEGPTGSTRFDGRHLLSIGVEGTVPGGVELRGTLGYGAGLPMTAVGLPSQGVQGTSALDDFHAPSTERVMCQRPSKAAQVWPSKIAHLAEVTSL